MHKSLYVICIVNSVNFILYYACSIPRLFDLSEVSEETISKYQYQYELVGKMDDDVKLIKVTV